METWPCDTDSITAAMDKSGLNINKERSLTVTETTGALDGTSYQFPWKLDSCGLDRYCQVTMTKLAYDLKYMDVKSLMLFVVTNVYLTLQ